MWTSSYWVLGTDYGAYAVLWGCLETADGTKRESTARTAHEPDLSLALVYLSACYPTTQSALANLSEQSLYHTTDGNTYAQINVRYGYSISLFTNKMRYLSKTKIVILLLRNVFNTPLTS